MTLIIVLFDIIRPMQRASVLLELVIYNRPTQMDDSLIAAAAGGAATLINTHLSRMIQPCRVGDVSYTAAQSKCSTQRI